MPPPLGSPPCFSWPSPLVTWSQALQGQAHVHLVLLCVPGPPKQGRAYSISVQISSQIVRSEGWVVAGPQEWVMAVGSPLLPPSPPFQTSSQKKAGPQET